MSGNWGYLGDDDWVNPAVDIGINDLSPDEGIFIGNIGRVAPRKRKVVKRPLTVGEKSTLKRLSKTQARGMVRAMLQKRPSAVPPSVKRALLQKAGVPKAAPKVPGRGGITPARAKRIVKARARANLNKVLKRGLPILPPAMQKMVRKRGFRNPMAFATLVSAPVMKKVLDKVKAKRMGELKAQKKRTMGVMRGLKKELNNAVKNGVMTKAQAAALYKKKRAEAMLKHKTAVRGINAKAKQEALKAKQAKVAVYAKVIKDRSIFIDKKIQEVEAEMRKIAAQKIPASTKAFLLKQLDGRKKKLLAAKELMNKQKGLANIRVMAEKGIIPKKKVARIAKQYKADIKRTEATQKAKLNRTRNIERMTSRLYKLGKWIQAYEGAIGYAEQIGAQSATIPTEFVGTKERGKVRGTEQVKLPLKTAKIKLVKLKQEYGKIEAQLKKLNPEKLPPLVFATTQTGTVVTPEMLKAQEKYIRDQIARGQLHPSRGTAAINELKKIDKLVRDGKKPLMDAKRQKPQRVVNIQVFISPKAMKNIRSGERMITTRAGTAKTKKMLPKPGMPSAVPHGVAKTTGSVRQLVKMQPTTTPKVVAGKTVPVARVMPTIARPQRPRPPRGHRRARVVISPFRTMSTDDLLQLFEPPKVKIGKRK